MGLLLSTRRALMGGSYSDKVLGMGPIAYWPLNELNGTAARCLVNPAQNGTYSSDVSTWPVGAGIGDGNTSPQFDGANDVIGIGTATFIAAFNYALCTVCGWAKVSAAGIWTDGASRQTIRIWTDAANYLYIRKNSVNNQFIFVRNPGGNETPAYSNTAWFHWAMTVSEVANQTKYYLNGVQQGVTDPAGAWVGAPVANTTCIGAARVAGPFEVWSGGLAHVAIFNRVLDISELLSLATV